MFDRNKVRRFLGERSVGDQGKAALNVSAEELKYQICFVGRADDEAVHVEGSGASPSCSSRPAYLSGIASRSSGAPTFLHERTVLIDCSALMRGRVRV